MVDKTKQIEVLVGSRTEEIAVFDSQIWFIFDEIARYNNNGGYYHEVTGDFNGKRDISSFRMQFNCTQGDFTDMVLKIKSIFRNIKPCGVEFVSIKSYDVASDSFSVIE